MEVTVNTALNINKGFVYIYGYNMVDFESFKEGLTKQYGLSSVIEATWIKSKRANSAKPLLLTFPNELPLYLDIPGEMMRTKVLEYKQRPLICRKCMEYGHGKNQCDREQTCSRCGMSGHGRDDCNSDEMKCFHCEGNHEAGSNLCIEYKYQEEILSIQAKERVSRHQAKALLERRNPHFKATNYAEVARSNTINIASNTNNSSTNSSRERKIKRQSASLGDERPARISEVEVVCRSPTSGELFTTMVNLPESAEQEVNLEGRTSENSAIVRAEVRKIFEQQGDKIAEDAAMEEDRQIYEDELERATRRSRETKKIEERKERRKRETTMGEKDRKRNRSANRESRSNSNNRRRQSQSKQRRL